MARRTVSLIFLGLFCLSAVPAGAQNAPGNDPPAHISLVDGAAVLERDGQVDSDPSSMPLLAGDRLRTQGGRVEVLFADGSALHVDANTVVDFQSDDVVRLLEGRIRLAIVGPAREVSYRVDAPSAWVQINDPGEYRVAVQRNEVELAVLRGTAELVNEQGRSYIRAGERTFAREGSSPSPAYVYNSASWDAFDRWSEARRDRRLGVSAQYLPNDVRPYASSFDNYGDWRYEQVHGYVWYPRVQVGWRPYHRGRWASLRPYGWTWIASDPWGWPTHHYGRWGLSAGSWFWIPGRTWGPAWVSWGYATDYVSWCPLGWNNRPVLGIYNVNVFGGHRYDPWHAWTVIPRRHFGGHYVNVRSIPAVRIDQQVHNTFVVRDAAPEARYAVGRAAPIRSAGRYAVPRGSVPNTSATDAARTGVDRQNDTRRLPSAARPSGAAAPSLGTSRAERSEAPSTGGSGRRAVPRASGDVAPTADTTSGAAGVVSRRPGVREYQSVPGGRAPSAEAGDRAVTAPPTGAVRVVPRTRQRSDAAPIDTPDSSQGRARSRSEGAPAYSAPAAPAASSPRQADDQPSVYRGTPGVRRAPDSGGSDYRRAVPRTEEARPAPSAPSSPSAPSYRSAPEQRRAPSGPPPSASQPQAQPSGDQGSSDRGAGSGSRPRSGGESSGQARRRR